MILQLGVNRIGTTRLQGLMVFSAKSIDGTMDNITIWAKEMLKYYSSEEVFQRFLIMNKVGNLNFSKSLIHLYNLGVVDDKTFIKNFDEKYFLAKSNGPNFDLNKVEQKELLNVYKIYKKNGVAGVTFIRKILGANSIKDLSLNNMDNSLSNKEHILIKNLIDAGQEIHPNAYKAFRKMATIVKRIFETEMGIDRDADYNSEKIVSIWKENFQQGLEYFQLIFNPDAKALSSQIRIAHRFKAIDDLAYNLFQVIPQRGLSKEQYFLLWNEMTAKGASQFSDQIIFEHFPNYEDIYKYLSPQTLLEEKRLKSERLQNNALKKFLENDLQKLSVNRGLLEDNEVSDFVNKIVRYVPGFSQYRDEFLEETSWELQLNKDQLKLFIEPHKSFNYKALDQKSVNTLSLVSILATGLKNQEKLEFVQFVREPHGRLMNRIPRMKSIIMPMSDSLNKMGLGQGEIDSFFDDIETHIRDASHIQRTTIIELFVGTRASGLWYQGDHWKQELLKLIDLGDQNSEERIAFDYYINDAAPDFEKTISVSHLLGSVNEGDDKSRVRQILEFFKTPGEKFAQFSSILSIFGEQYNEDLSKTKSEASPPTRLEALERVDDLFPGKEIKSVEKLLGSGSIKYVVLVEFTNGTRAALAIRKPNLEATIESTMDIIDKWVQSAGSDPRLSGKYDFSFYAKSLREQLASEVKFSNEVKNNDLMVKYYRKIRSPNDWRLSVVPYKKNYKNNEEVITFAAIENGVKFKDLSDADKVKASELILKAELELLFNYGIYDADRHIENYLFDPVTKTIHVIDMGQVYQIKPHGWFKKGDMYNFSRILQAFAGGSKDAAKLATLLTNFHSGSKWSGSLDNLARDLKQLLNSSQSNREKLSSVLGLINQHKIHFPLHISMGIMKSVLMLTNEEYAKHLGEARIFKLLEEKVTKTLLKSAPLKILKDSCTDLVAAFSLPFLN